MPWRARIQPGGVIFHAVNCANSRAATFAGDSDYPTFEMLTEMPSWRKWDHAQRGRPFGEQRWQRRTAPRPFPTHTFHRRIRPAERQRADSK